MIITQSAPRNKNNRDSYQNQQAYLESFDDDNGEDKKDDGRKY